MEIIDNVHHIIPKYLVHYVGESFQGDIADPYVCITDNSDNCWRLSDSDLENLFKNTTTIVEGGEIPTSPDANP